MAAEKHKCRLSDVLTPDELVVLGELLESALEEASDVLEQAKREAPPVEGSAAEGAEAYLAVIATQEERVRVLKRIQQLLLH